MARSEFHTTPARSHLPVTLVAAAIGLGGGLVFGGPALTLLERAWTGFMLPAFLEIQQSGLPFCG